MIAAGAGHSLRVVFVQSYVPHYRVPFCEGLRRWLGERGVCFDVVHGESDPLKPGHRRDAGQLPWAATVPNRVLASPMGPVLWQPALGLVRNADLVIVTQENRLLLNYGLLLQRAMSGRVVAYWGHGRNFQASSRGPQRLRRWLMRQADWWFAYTELSRDALQGAGVPGGRITVVNNSHDTRQLLSDLAAITPEDTARLRRELGIAGAHVGVFCSSLHAGKRLDWLLRAADECRRRCDDFELVIVGDGDQRPMLDAAAVTRPWMHVVGARYGREKAAYLALGDVFLMPYFVGLSVLDAFCRGIPVVAVRGGQHSPEIAYIRDGENGLLTDPEPAHYAQEIVELLRDRERLRRMQEASRRSADYFTLDSMVERFGGGILRCLARHFPDRISPGARDLVAHRPADLRHVTTRVIHPALAPYRIDLFNRVAAATDLDLILLNPTLAYHPELDQVGLRERLSRPPRHLERQWNIARRDVPVGLFSALLRGNQDVVVTTEFSLPTVFTIVARMVTERPFGHLIWSDENLSTLSSHGWIRRFLRRWCARHVDGLLMCTDDLADAFAKEFGVDRRHIWICSVHQSERAMRARAEAAVSTAKRIVDRYDLANKRVILFVGRLAAVKNLDTMLRAFGQVLAPDSEAVFALVGGGAERDRLEALANGLGLGSRVIFAGHQEGADLFGWYRVASILALPSTYEPYGAVVNEALACGVPVLVSDRAGACVLVEPGRNGWVVEPTLTALAEGLRQSLPWLQPAGDLVAECRQDLMVKHRFQESVEGFLDGVWHAAAQAQTGRR